MAVLRIAFILLCIAQVQSIVLPKLPVDPLDVVSTIAGQLLDTQLKGLAEMTSELIKNCFEDATYKPSAETMTKAFFSKVQLTNIAAFSKNNTDASEILAEELAKEFLPSSKSLPIFIELKIMLKCVKLTVLVEYYFSVLLSSSTKTKILDQVNECAVSATGNQENVKKAKELIIQGITCIDDAKDKLAKAYNSIAKPLTLPVAILNPLDVLSDIVKDIADIALEGLAKVSLGGIKGCFTDAAYENVYIKMHSPFFKNVKLDHILEFNKGNKDSAKSIIDAVASGYRSIFADLPFGKEVIEIVDCVGIAALVEYDFISVLPVPSPNLEEKFNNCAQKKESNDNTKKALELLTQAVKCAAKNKQAIATAFEKVEL